MKKQSLLLICALSTSTGLLFGSQGRVSFQPIRPIEGTQLAAHFNAKKLTLREVAEFVQKQPSTNSKIEVHSKEAQRLEEQACQPKIPLYELENAYAYLLLVAQCWKHDFMKNYSLNTAEAEKAFKQAEALIAGRLHEPTVMALAHKAFELKLVEQKTIRPGEREHQKHDTGTKMDSETNKLQTASRSTAHLWKAIRWIGGGLALATCAAAIWYFGFHNKKASPLAKKTA